MRDRTLIALHLAAARKEAREDAPRFDAGDFESILEGRARVVSMAGERIAVFRHQGRAYALSNVCAHQNGPLGEGKILDACITCPWHEHQYRLETGAAPPPFTERVATFETRISNGRVFVEACTGAPMDEFFVGYFPAPPGIRRFVTCGVIGLAAMAVGIALVLVLAQSPFVASRFEFQRYGFYEGWMSALPYPALSTGWLLVGPGKHGFAGGSSAYVKLEGGRIQNGRDRMLEILPGSVRAVAGVAPREEERDLGVVEWMGEIVDTKCYFGVMNPGRGKVHRDCAARCISGGIPPGLLVRDATGESRTVLLSGADRRPLRAEVLRYVAEPVTARGRLRRTGRGLSMLVSGMRSR